jgi:hypothetical protein
MLLRSARRNVRRIVGAALLALLLAQWLAFAHAVLHAAQARPALAFAAVEAAQPDVFGHAAGTPECRLVDQVLSGADGLLAAPVVAQAAPESVVAAPGEAPRGESAPRPYQARAPPRA